MTESAGAVCETGCEGLIVGLLLAVVVIALVWLSWVLAVGWWLRERGWRALHAWPAAIGLVVLATWILRWIMGMDALSPLTPLLSLAMAGPVVALVMGLRRRRSRSTTAQASDT